MFRVGGPGAGRVDEAERLEVRVAVGAGQAGDDLAGLGVGEEEVDVEDVTRGEEGEVLPVGAIGWADVEHSAGALLHAADERRAEVRRLYFKYRRVHILCRYVPVGKVRYGVDPLGD